MERKSCNISEALSYMFKGNAPVKILCSLLLWIPALILLLITRNNALAPTAATAIYLMIIKLISSLAGITFCGYFILYAHDRALDKNAQFRNWTECFFDAFLIGMKNILGGGVVFVGLAVVGAIACFLINLILMLLSFIPVVPFIIGLIVDIFIFAILLRFFFKFATNFIKDLRLSSWYRWPSAMDLTNDVCYGKLASFLIVVLYLLYVISFFAVIIIANPYLLSPMGLLNPQPPVVPVFGMIPCYVVALYAMLYFYSYLGQNTYNAIAQNTGLEPETLPKEINQDKVLTVILSSVIVGIYVLILIIATFIAQQTAKYGYMGANGNVPVPMQNGMPQQVPPPMPNEYSQQTPPPMTAGNRQKPVEFITFDADGAVRNLEKAIEFMPKQPDDLSSKGLRDYFANWMGVSPESVGDNQVVETFSKTTYTFHGDGSCKSNGCYVTVDLYGADGPNEKWTSSADPKDIFDIHLKFDNSGKMQVIKPNVMK